MNNEITNSDELNSIINIFVMLTLLFHLPTGEVEKHFRSEYEFNIVYHNNLPQELHVWEGKNHNFQQEFHKVYFVPDHLQKPLC